MNGLRRRLVATLIVAVATGLGCVSPSGGVELPPCEGDCDSSETELVALALSSAQGNSVPAVSWLSALAIERNRPAQRLSEPGRIVNLAWTYHLGRQAPSFPRQEFIETLMTRLAYLIALGEATGRNGRDDGRVLSPSEVANVLEQVRSGGLQTFGNRTRNNREAREAAALSIARIILEHIGQSKERPEVFGFSVLSLLEQGPFVASSERALRQMFNPAPGINERSYAIATRDGAYKEGPGYLKFTYEVLMPLVFFTRTYEGVNLFAEDHRYGEGFASRLRGVHDWLLGSQNVGGTWPSMEDSAGIGRGWILEPLLAARLFGSSDDRTVRTELRNLRRRGAAAMCRNLGAVNGAVDLEGMVAECRTSCATAKVPSRCRAACGNDAELASVLRHGDQPFLDWLASVTCDEAGAAREHLYRNGGHLFVTSAEGVQLRFTNQGNFWEGRNETCGQAPPSFGDASAQGLAYRGCNHNRFDDQHLEIEVGGRDLLAGPGKVGYAGDGFPHEAWNRPESYNLPSVGSFFPKVIYQGAQGAGQNLRRLSLDGEATLYEAPGDNVTRYILSAGAAYFVVVDVPQPAALPGAPIVSTFRFRSQTPQCSGSRCDFPFAEKPLIAPVSLDPPTIDSAVAVEPLIEDGNLRVRYRRLTDGSHEIRDVFGTCSDGVYQTKVSSSAGHRFCIQKAVIQSVTGPFAAAVLEPLGAGMSGPRTTKVHSEQDGTLAFSIGNDRWSFTVVGDGYRNVLRVARF